MKKYGQEFLNQLDTAEYLEFPIEDIIDEDNKKLYENINENKINGSEINSNESKEVYKGGRQV